MSLGYIDNIRRVTPYTPGEQPGRTDVIKLNTNECPYPTSPLVARAAEQLDTGRLRLYPDPVAADLIRAWAKEKGLEEDQVFPGVGSDDVLSMCFLAFFASGKPVLFPDITYSFYDVWCDVYRIPFETRPLNGDFEIEPEDYIGGDPGGIVIANPNAPTGRKLPLEAIERIVSSNPGCVVIVDEAYVDFGASSAVSLIGKYDNLAVVQTFSKSRAMAGMRIGFAMGDAQLIKYLNDVKYSVNSYTMSYPAIALGCAAISDREYFEKTVAKICATRERTAERLRELGFSFPDSSANFIFARHEKKSGREIFEELRNRNIFVRRWDRDRIADHLRITIGTDEQMDALFAALEEIL